MNAEFDAYANDYESALERGLVVSGEGSEYFARERIAWLSSYPSVRRLRACKVLDYGCGTGNAIPYFFEYLDATSVVGVDLSAESLDVARRKHVHSDVEYHHLNEFAPNGSFDLAFCNGVFHHIPPGERVRALEYISASLRPGGIFAMWENNPWSPAARYVMSRIPFDRDAVMVWPSQARQLIHQAGLTPIDMSFRFIFPRCLSLLRRFERCLQTLPFGAQFQLLSQKRGPTEVKGVTSCP